jgi:tripartite-type tricarboxylate transporter receptor subunit TctC
MFKTLKAAVLAASFMVAQVAWAEKITVVIPHPPGGGLDQVMQVIKSAAQRQGNEIEIQYHKSCAEAIEVVRRGDKNTFLNIASDVYDPKNPEAKCVLDSDKDKIQVWGSPVSSPYYFCSAPDKKFTLAEMSAQPQKVGVVSAPDLMAYLGYALTNTKQPNQIQVTPYRGGGEIVKAARAGDIDLWFGASQIRAFPSDQIVCYGSSVKNDPRGIPFIGDLVKSGVNIPEFPLVNVLMAVPGNVSKTADSALKAAINSEELKAYVAKNFMAAGTFDGNKLHNELVTLVQDVKKMQSK